LAGADGIEICKRRTDVFDRAVQSLAESHVSEDAAVLAVGGYGRRELCPGSDLDLLFAHEQGREDAIRGVVDAVLYPLWDAGFLVSQAIRTPEESRLQSEQDLASLTSLLDARLLTGSAELLELTRSAAKETIAADRAGFIKKIRDSHSERSRRFGSLGRILEGDVRDSTGGLRDMQILRWFVALGIRAGDGQPHSPTYEDVVDDSRRFLLLVRTALHRASGMRSNRLAADLHEPIAHLLAVPVEESWEPRDVLVRTVAEQARWVEYVYDRQDGRWQLLSIAVKASPDVMARFRQYAIALDEPLHRGSGHHPTDPETVRKRLASFLEILLSAQPYSSRVLEVIDADGWISEQIPEWKGVRGRPQRDPYHQYHVDTHLVRTVERVNRLLAKPHDQFAESAAAASESRQAMLIGALLHDIGKVGQGSHVALGVDMAGHVLDRLDVDAEVRSDVLFLVGEHLLLADSATRRNLEDEDLILHVGAKIGDQRRLAMLYLLTVADAEATGPSASTPWRMGLVRELVGKVGRAFERGLMDPGRAARIVQAEAHVRAAMTDAGRAAEDADAFVATVPTGYLLWANPADASSHAGLVTPIPEPDEVRTHVRPGASAGTYQLSVGAVDRLGLLAAVSGALTLAGLAILSAQAFTTQGGVALDVFEVRGAFEEEIAEERWVRFRSALFGAIEGRLDLGERVRALRAHYPPASQGVPTTVRTDQEASDFSTVVEVGGPDRLGLLFDLAQAFADERVDVHVAKVATYGPRVLDVFYVRDEAGEKLADPERISALERALRGAV
jgi:[protein-PII] uridylyltransferase